MRNHSAPDTEESDEPLQHAGGEGGDADAFGMV